MTLGQHVRPILVLAWPVLVGQLAVLAFGTMDTILVGRSSPTELAALAVGMSAYITVFIGLMGVVLAISPTVGQLFGAGRLHEAGAQAHQAFWLALGLAALGSSLLMWPDPFLALAHSPPDVADKVRGYLHALAFSLPASLLFTVYRGFNNAVSRPKAVMVLQLLGLTVKWPLSWLAVQGWPAMGWSPVGVAGCGWATAAAMWSQCLLAFWWVRRDPFYDRFALWGHGFHAPHWPSLKALLLLGMPMGLTILAEITGFSFMALFIARLGALPVAAHQIAVNLVSVMFMVPMALANATTTLVAQQVGAGRLSQARQVGWQGLMLGTCVAAVVGLAIHLGRRQVVGLYTQDAALAALAVSLLGWVAVFHVADAVQVLAAFVLRAWKVTTAPALIYVAGLSGVGLLGGNVLGFNLTGHIPPAWQGAQGFWIACTTGLILVAVALALLLVWVMRGKAQLKDEWAA